MFNVSVVIPTYNRSDLLEKTLISLCEQTLDSRFFEVIVVDDGGYDNSREICEKYISNLNIRYFWQRDNGFRAGKARNIGIAAAEGDYIVFIDSGVLLQQNALERHLSVHQRCAHPLVCIGYVYGFEIPEKYFSFVERNINIHDVNASIDVLKEVNALDIRQSQYDELGYKISCWPAPFDIFWTCHVSAQRSELIKAGMFDESFNTWGGEDVDLGVRLFIANNKFYMSPDICSIHVPHKKETDDHNQASESAASKINEKYRLWQTSYYNLPSNDEKFSLNKTIYKFISE